MSAMTLATELRDKACDLVDRALGEVPAEPEARESLIQGALLDQHVRMHLRLAEYARDDQHDDDTYWRELWRALHLAEEHDR